MYMKNLHLQADLFMGASVASTYTKFIGITSKYGANSI